MADLENTENTDSKVVTLGSLKKFKTMLLEHTDAKYAPISINVNDTDIPVSDIATLYANEHQDEETHADYYTKSEIDTRMGAIEDILTELGL